MPERFTNLLDSLRRQRALRAWTRAAENVRDLPPRDLNDLSRSARALRQQIDILTHEADARLKGPRIGQDSIDTPSQCDWAWRPDAWRGAIRPSGIAGLQTGAGIGEGLKIFHDCPLGEITLRQVRNTADKLRAPFGLVLDVLSFEGSFLSLVFDLPEDGRGTMRRSHIVRLTGKMHSERPIEAFARLNVKHGPNTEQMVSQLLAEDGSFQCEFDLGHARMNERRLENVWLDIIFDNPAMNRVVISDLTLMRRPRAEI